MSVIQNPYSEDFLKDKRISNRESKTGDTASRRSLKPINKLSQSVENLRDKGRRNVEEFPNHYKNFKDGIYN